MSYIPNRSNNISEFKVGDTVVYNPYSDNLLDPIDRPRDIGKIVKIDLFKGYIYINAESSTRSGIRVPSIDHYPQRKNKIIIIKI